MTWPRPCSVTAMPERWLLLCLCCLVLAARADDAVLKFGSVAMDIPAVMHQRLGPLTDYLSRRLQRPVQLQLSADMPAAIDNIANGEVDLAYLTPVAYLRAYEQGDVQLVVKTVTQGAGAFRLMIVVPERSPVETPSDLAGKRFAFGDEAALLQRAVVVGAGMPLERLGDYQFIGHYDNIVRAVVNGDFDAGILKDTMAYKWAGKGIRVIHASPELPPYNIAARGKLPAGLLAEIRQAFLDLDPDRPEDLAIITALDPAYDGFAPVSDAEYDVVRQLIRPFRN